MDTAEICRRIVEATSDAVIFADRNGLIRLWNRGAELLFGHTAREAVGESLDIIIPERLRRAHWEAFDRSLQSGRTKYTDRVLTTRAVRKGGGRLYVDLGFGLVKDADGAMLGAFAIGRDCTARHLADRELETRVRALQAQLGGAPSSP